uniref:Uncharacterized protein n=1 Tax=Anguilla anguilla TaxID=7936 RepID=A0A0E9WAK4_ANGAN
MCLLFGHDNISSWPCHRYTIFLQSHPNVECPIHILCTRVLIYTPAVSLRG